MIILLLIVLTFKISFYQFFGSNVIYVQQQSVFSTLSKSTLRLTLTSVTCKLLVSDTYA